MEWKVVIADPIGLHARPASLIVQEANKHNGDIKILGDGKEANLKSIMSVMALGIRNGVEVTIIAEGDDATEAIAGIKKVMTDNKLV